MSPARTQQDRYAPRDPQHARWGIGRPEQGGRCRVARIGLRVEDWRELAALGRERSEERRARNPHRCPRPRKRLKRRLPPQQPGDGDRIALDQHPPPVHRQQEVPRRIDREAEVRREACAGRARRRADRLVIVRKRERGEVRERRMRRGAARTVGGKEGVGARDQGRAARRLGAGPRHERAREAITGRGHRHGGGPRQRQAVTRRPEDSIRIRKTEAQVLVVEDLEVDWAPDLVRPDARRAGRAGTPPDARAIRGEHDHIARPSPRRGEDDGNDLIAGGRGERPRDGVAGRIEAERDNIPGAREGTVDSRLRRAEGLCRPGDDIADREAAAARNEQNREGGAADAQGDGSARRRAMSPLRCSEASLESGRGSPSPSIRGTRRYPRSSAPVNGNS